MKKLNKILFVIIAGIFAAGIASASLGEYWSTVSHIIPRTNDTVDLGSTAKRVRTLFVNNLTCTDCVDDTNIDWGTGANQVSSSDMPDHNSHTVRDTFVDIINRGKSEAITITLTGGLGVSWTVGELYDGNTNTFFSTDAGSGNVTNNAVNYLKWVSGTTLTLSTTETSGDEILIATGLVYDGNINCYRETSLMNETVANTRRGLRALFPTRVISGMSVHEDTDVTNSLDVTMDAGVFYKDAIEKKTPIEIKSRNTAMIRNFHTAGVWDSDTNAQIETTNYDNGTNLTAIPGSKYVKGVFIFMCDNIGFVYPTEYFNTIAQAQDAALPTLPPGLEPVPKLTAIVYQQGAANFTGAIWQDVRAGISEESFSGVTDHGALAGLSDDDHTQYLLADGSRNLGGAWNLGGQNLTNGGTITASFTGALTGQADTVATITGLAPDTATTQATQAGITTCANLTTVGTIGTGVWSGTSIADANVDNDITIDLATLATTANAGDAAVDFFGAGVDAVTDATTCTDIEGTGLSITTSTLNWSASGIAGHDSFSDFVANEHLDWTSDLGATNIHAGNYTTLTNLTDFDQTAWRLFYSNNLGDVIELSLGTDGQYLQSQGGTSSLTWSVPTDTTANETITLSGDVTGSGETAITTTIGANKVLESHLKAVDAAADEECLTYEATTGDFEWQTCSAGAGDITSVFDCADGDCNTMTVGTSEYLTYGTGYIDANRFAGVTTVDATEFGYLDGVSSAIQTQFGGKQSTLTNSAGLLAALSDETGTGLSVFSTSPTFTTGITVPNDSISAAELNEGDAFTWTSTHDFGGATSLEIPNGAAPTVNAIGEIALDTTSDQLVYYGSAKRVLQEEDTKCFTIESLAAADDNMEIFMADDAVTITAIGLHCAGTCTTGADISLEDRAGNAMTHTTPTHSTGSGNTTFQAVTAANTLVAGEGLRFDVDNAVSPETDTYLICFKMKYTSD